MLVLTRKKKEGIQIGDNIRVVIVSIDGSNVRIGIEAPKNIKVYRDEIIPPPNTGNSVGNEPS